MFELGTWALLGIAAFVIAGVISAKIDSALAAALAFLIAIVTIEWALGISVLAIVYTNTLWFFVILVLYIAAGVIYTVFWRWPKYIRDRKDIIMKDYARWAALLARNENNSFDAFLDSDDYKFNAWQHKERLVSWVSMWPFSLGCELSHKPLSWIWNIAHGRIGNIFQRTSRRTARKLHEEG